MDLEAELISEGTEDYKCYDILRTLLQDDKFYDYVKNGLNNKKVFGFTADLWEDIRNQNVRTISSFEDVFREGANKGRCTVMSKQLSYSFDTCDICGGVLPILVGTVNCPDGSHTWISKDGYVIDTSLMLIIEENYSKELGYREENRYNPNENSFYRAAKDFTNDSNLKPKISK